MAFLIDQIDTSGLFAQSAYSAGIATKDSNGNDITATYLSANQPITAQHLISSGTMGNNIVQTKSDANFYYMPYSSPWTTADVATGIFSPLQYATGACLAMNNASFKAYYKGNEWFIGNTGIGQMLRGEVHNSRGVHITGATTAGYNFNLSTSGVSGNYAGGAWNYGPEEYSAVKEISGKQPSGDYYSASNPSGFITELPASATDVIDTVTAYSGTWGGSALPISAGPGIKMEMVNNTLVFSNDETVLWTGTLASGSTATLSENISSFNKIAFVGYSHNGSNYVANGESNVNGTSVSLVGLTYWPGEVDFVECRINNTTLTSDGTIVLSPTQGNKFDGYITKVIGIGRKN